MTLKPLFSAWLSTHLNGCLSEWHRLSLLPQSLDFSLPARKNERINRSVSNMKKKVIGIIDAIVVVMGLGLVVYNQIIPNEYVPADDEIALHLQLDTE